MKFQLKSAHYFPGDLYLVGDKEAPDKPDGTSGGTFVGDGTKYPVVRLRDAKPGDMTPTLEMLPLDEEAVEAIAEEQERLERSQASMLPIEQLARTMDAAKMADGYENIYVPGYPSARRGK